MSDDVLAHLQLLIVAHPGLVLDGEDQATFAREVPDLAAIVAAKPRDPLLLVHVIWALRKLGRFEEAFAAASHALSVARTFGIVTATGSVYRAICDPDRAARLFDEAAGIDRTDTSALMEGARTFGECSRFDDARRWFGRVLDRDPGHEGALAWRAYAGYCASDDAEVIAPHVAELRALADAGNQTAVGLLESVAS